MLLVLNRERGITGRRMAECTIEASFRLLNKAGRCPEKPLCIQRSVNGRRIVSGKTAGCDCGRSCGGGIGRCDRLAADCCALQPIGTNSAFASCTAKSCRGHCNARWSRGRSDAYRRGVGTWRIGKLLPGAFSPCRYVPQARQDSRGSVSYEKALALTQQEPERQFLQERIRQLK